MFAARRKTSIPFQQSFKRCTVQICSYWVRIACSCLGDREASSFAVCKPFHLWNWSEALRSYLSKIINQATPRLQRILIRAFPYHFTVWHILGLTNQLADCLSHLGGQRTLSSTLSCMLTRLPIHCVWEATAYNKLELLHKMMSLCCSSIPSHKVGQTQLMKFPVFYSLIGHLERN